MNINKLMSIVIAICLGISFNVFAKSYESNESNERYSENDYYSDDYSNNEKNYDDDDDDSYYEHKYKYKYSYSSDNYEYSDDEDSYNEDDYSQHDYYGHEYDDNGKYRKNKKTDRHLVYNLIGTGEMFSRKVPDIDGDGNKDDAICFKVQLVNLKNQKEIGTAIDCLSNIEAKSDDEGGGIRLVGTTFFKTPHGKLVTRGETTVQEALHDIVTPNGVKITHITGASSKNNSVLRGTGRFKNSKGTVRLSGMVDMSKFNDEDGNLITFDCLFVIDLKSSNYYTNDDYVENDYSDDGYSDEDDTDYSDSDYSDDYSSTY
ncbi:hypothetical protein [Photobacterium profundum]|uniref:Uncharacterized protein n=1 Tax=Photobacterium profundum 3TCK TaxID=314280 RepID=Q1Z1W5_9GAMM|nr:hypothetical protein [Photobacterium profundum]EAS42548.1 hypothetical protein P3TCK_19205 [Photobacterium profundum 3TCK]